MSGGKTFDQEGIQDERIVRLLTEIRDAQDDQAAQLRNAEANLTTHIVDAFPGGDAGGHKRYHETQIEMLEERRRLRVAIQEKTISGLVWAGIVAAGTAVYHYYFRP